MIRSERSERACAISRSLETGGDGLRVRIGINTGEVLVAMDARPEAGEGYVTGDAVNTASRLQGVAPEMGIVVGEATFGAARGDFELEALEPVAVKGKAAPVPIWRVIGERASPLGGDVSDAGPLVGRDLELGLLNQLYRRAAEDPSTSFVTIVADAGMGKSRLVRELARATAEGASGPVWRQGRCLPFGDGGSFAALAQIVKAHGGILDTDAPEAVEAKLREALTGVEPGRRPWVQERLATLVGLDAEAAMDRAETFSAWRTFLESLAADGPAVVVIEDLHWADDALVGFLADVADRTAGLPLLVVVTARPAVEDRHPSWFTRARRSTVLSLPPLADRDVAALVSTVLPDASPEMTAAVLERAGGSPLYAEQLAASVREGESAADPTAVPATVQALVAARLDTLSPDVKSLVQDAAVVGRAFWPGVLAALGDRDATQVGSMIDDLIRRELVRPSTPSTMANERELAFWHVMVRDVAYASIPRAVRMSKHRAVAEWLNEHAGGEDLADATAQHLVLAADLAVELGRTDDEASLREPLLAALMRAGDRARKTFAAELAIDRYDRAVPLASQVAADDVLACLLLSRGEVREQLGRFEEAQADYEAARDAAGRAGLPADEARALAALSHVLWLEDRYDEGEGVLAHALEHARAAGANDLVAHLLYTAGTLAFGRAHFDEALAHHQEAIRVAREHGDALGEAMSLHGLCETRFFLGPFSRSLADGLEADRAFRTLGQRPMVFHNLYMVAWAHWLRGELHAALAAFDESIEGCRELGNRRDEGFAMSRGMAQLVLGDLGAAAADPTHAIELAADMRTPRMDLAQRSVRMHAWAELGAVDRLRADLDRCEEISASLGGSFYRPRSFAWEGWFALMDGDPAKAADLFAEGLREAGGVELDVVWNSWIELLAAEEHGDSNSIRTAAAHLAEGAGDDALGLADWAVYGRALADAREGGDVEEVARGVVAAAERRGDQMLQWRASALQADALSTRGHMIAAAAARARSAGIVRAIATTAPEDETRATYVARSPVASLLSSPMDAWFADLDAAVLTAVSDQGDARDLVDGGPVDTGQVVIGVDAGLVRLLEGEAVIARVGPGEVFGVETLAGVDPPWRAEADPETRVVLFGAEAFASFLAGSSRTTDRVIAGMATRLETMPPGAASAQASIRTIEHLAQRGRGDGIVEVFPVLLRGSALLWLRAAGQDHPLRVASTTDGHPGDVVLAQLASGGLEPIAVHSTSWRTEGDRVVLTYLAVVPHGADGWGEDDVQRTDLARGSSHGAPTRIDVTQVIEHGLRHLSWLSKDDPVIRDLLSLEWMRVLGEYTPEPFRMLGG